MDESSRLQSLVEYNILDSLPEKDYDTFVKLSAIICGTPISFISFVDAKRTWLKSGIGIDLCEVPREHSFCTYAIQHENVMIVEDADIDSRFSQNPFVVGEGGIKFYAGAPLISADGAKVGFLCVADYSPRSINRDQVRGLRLLATQVMRLMEQRSLVFELEEVRKGLTKARAEAEANFSKRTEFLANMSHEIRTPMNGIIGMTDLLLESTLTEDQMRKLSILKNSSVALLQVINDVLDFSKLESNKVRLKVQPFDTRRVFVDAVGLYQILADKKDLNLSLKINQDVPRGLACDVDRLRQILNNLICNSVKFTDRGSIEVSVSSHRLKDGLHQLRVGVKDTGIGISTDDQKKLFRAFSQVDAAGARTRGGTGLGLSITLALIQLMGGEINLSSSLGEGSTFSFVLPAAEVELLSETRNMDSPKPKSLRVLVAEDNSTNMIVTLAHLKKLGITAATCENGRAAVQLSTQSTFDLILMDCHMPELDGFDATREIRNFNLSARPIIVALTASARAEDRTKCLQAGMDDFLTKPVRRKDLQDLIERIFPDQYKCGLNAS